MIEHSRIIKRGRPKKRSQQGGNCAFCNKKLMCVFVTCQDCKNMFCMRCRLPETHECSDMNARRARERSRQTASVMANATTQSRGHVPIY